MGTIWMKTSKLPAFSPLAQSVRAEVAVIGGGIAGILTAFFSETSRKRCDRS